MEALKQNIFFRGYFKRKAKADEKLKNETERENAAEAEEVKTDTE